MAASKKTDGSSMKVLACLSAIFAVVLIVAGFALCKAGNAAVTMVNKGLVEEKIYFPPAGPMFSEEVFPDAQKYAGKQVKTGDVAKIYAEDYLGPQLKMMGGGKTLSEVSAMVAMDPTNMQLQQMQGAMFQANTSKSLMLGNAYGPWMQGKVMSMLGLWATVLGVLLGIVAVVKYMRYKKA